MLYINFDSELNKEILGEILDVLGDTVEDLYYCDLITEHSYSFEMIYHSEAREFVIKNIDSVLEELEEIQFSFGSLDILFDKEGKDIDLSLYRLANIVYQHRAERIYFELLRGFEETTGADIWNDWIGDDLETFEAFKDYANKVYNSINTY